MRISELSERSGVSVATIKFYVREGLLAVPVTVGYNRTEYDEGHLERLRLIKTLVDVGGLSLAAVGRVLTAIDDVDLPIFEVMGVAHCAIPVRAAQPSADSLAEVEALLAERGWQVGPENVGVPLSATVLDAYKGLGHGELQALISAYADAAEIIARADVDIVLAAQNRASISETVIVGTVLGDSLLQGLRRIAQEARARQLSGPETDS